MISTERIRLPISRVANEQVPSHAGRDARFHLGLAIIGSIVLLLNQHLMFQFLFFALLLFTLLWWRIPIRTVAVSIIPVLFMMILTVVYHLLFFDPALSEYGARPIFYSPALDRGLFFAFRLGGLYLLIVQLVRSTSTDALADAFTSYLWPLRKIGVPVVPLVLALRAGLSTIPGLMRSVNEVQDAVAMSRLHAHVRRGSVSSRLRNLPQLFTPLLILVVRRADQMVLAIRARGYQTDQTMTRYSDLRWGMHETAEGIVLTLIFFLMWRFSL